MNPESLPLEIHYFQYKQEINQVKNYKWGSSRNPGNAKCILALHSHSFWETYTPWWPWSCRQLAVCCCSVAKFPTLIKLTRTQGVPGENWVKIYIKKKKKRKKGQRQKETLHKLFYCKSKCFFKAKFQLDIFGALSCSYFSWQISTTQVLAHTHPKTCSGMRKRMRKRQSPWADIRTV